MSAAEGVFALTAPAAVSAPEGEESGPPGGAEGSSSLLMSPWLVGFTAFFGYPLV